MTLTPQDFVSKWKRSTKWRVNLWHNNKGVGFMKPALSLIILGLILVSCTAKSQGASPQPSATGSAPLPTATSIELAPTPTITAIVQAENTPTNAAPASISLSPIDVGNADQIQLLFTAHVAWDALYYGFVVVSSDGKWVALAPKYGSPLSLLPLTWTPDHSIVPVIDAASSRTYQLRSEALAFSPDATSLAIADGEDSVTVFDLEHPNEVKTIHVADWPSAVTFTKDSQKLVIGTKRGFEGSLQLWDLETTTLEREISRNAPSGGICSVAVSPDGKILAAGYCTYVFDISTWEIDKGYKSLARLAGLDEIGYCPHFCIDDRNILAFNPATGDIASGTNYDRIPIQDPRTGKLSSTITTGGSVNGFGYDGGPTNALAFTPDGAVLMVLASSELQLRDAKDGRLLWKHSYDATQASMDAVAMTADARLLISVDSKGEVTFWGIPKK